MRPLYSPERMKGSYWYQDNFADDKPLTAKKPENERNVVPPIAKEV